MLEWGDLRHFLAVARSGSTLAASRVLGCNQTTVARRIAALEDALEEKLFDRVGGRYRLTELGVALTPQAERVEAEIESFKRAASQRGRKLTGVIRVTANEVLADYLINPWLGEFTDRFTFVQVDLIITDDRLDLSRGEADIALRASASLPEGENLVVRRLATGKFGVYCSRAYAAEWGKPSGLEDFGDHSIVAGSGNLLPLEAPVIKEARERGATVRTTSSSITGVTAAIRGGIGVGCVPCVLGGLDPDMELCFTYDEADYQLLLITREEMRALPHVRAFNDFIASRTAALRHIIEGRS